MIHRANVLKLEPLPLVRVVASPAALAAANWQNGSLRVAPDEVLAFAGTPLKQLVDEHAIIELEESFLGAWATEKEALEILERFCEWELPRERPVFAQGSVAGLPLKLWFTDGRVLFLVPLAYQTEFEERISKERQP
jgi:hypothetical protein